MAIEVTRVGADLGDGRVIGPYRLGIGAQVQWSKTAKARGYSHQDEALGVAFMIWWTAKMRGDLEMTWEEFSTSSEIVAGKWEDDEAEQETEAARNDALDPIYQTTPGVSSSPSPSDPESPSPLG